MADEDEATGSDGSPWISDPDKVPGRRTAPRAPRRYGDGPQPPKYGRASAATAGSDDYVSIDDMLGGSGGLAGGTRTSCCIRAPGGHETAERVVRARSPRRPEKAKAAGLGVGQMGSRAHSGSVRSAPRPRR